MSVPLLRREQHWECPNCDFTDVTWHAEPHSHFHSCRGLFALSVPMVPAGTRCKIVAVEREDYIAGDDVQFAGNGRPVMSVVTVRDEGQDCTAYAPCARARMADVL